MSSFDLRVAISKPLWGEYYHWSLDVYDENQDTHWVVEALGEPYCFTASSDDYDPKSLPQWWKCIDISRLEHVEVEDLQGIIESVPIRNDLAYWNCQDYVIEILDALEEAELVKKTSNYEYVKAALIQMVGPVEDTRHHILAYRAIDEEGNDEDYDPCDENEADGGASEDDKKIHRVLSEEFVVDPDEDDETVFER